MTSTTTAVASAPLSRDETGALFGQTMGFVALTSGFFALGAYLARDMGGGLAWVFLIASIAALFAMQAAVQRSEQLAIALLSHDLRSQRVMRCRRSDGRTHDRWRS